MRDLVLVLGDQLTHDSPALAGIDPTQDAVLMIEAPGEATHVWSHVARIALFLAAMRHFRDALRARGFTVHYLALGDVAEPTLAGRLHDVLRRERPRALRMLEPGEWRVARAIESAAASAGVDLLMLDDPHFLCSRADFARWAGPGRRSLRMEHFYREMRRRHRVLLDAHGQPEGGRWNFDADNRSAYPRQGPGPIPPPAGFAPDALTRQVIDEVRARFGSHPGSLDAFRWPVTREQALEALSVFVASRLPHFGEHQDAMWSATPFGWHSLLSTSLNLHLLDPREVIAAAEDAYRRADAPLASVEGFIRQVLGWREFIRGVYWRDMPGLASANHYGHARPLPAWYWNGQTRMACLREAIGQTLRHGYAHHIQRLMVTGLFALLAEVDPRRVAEWYLAIYVDAVEWVELPNVAGMALFADGGRFTSKPYIASGAYIDRMSDHCRHCRYAPKPSRGAAPDRPACPFTTLYWYFLDRHAVELAANPRTALMAKQVARLDPRERSAIRERAATLLADIDEL
ncbi:MAG: cryptochrome/photolyase family protein [Lautropia sp.]